MIFKFRFLFLLTAWLMVGTATAGISYKLEQTHAVAGETVNISAVVFNDTGTLMSWTAPANLVIQWRDHNGQSIRSLAYLQGNQSAINIPVNNFVKLSWSAIVPTGVNGLQAVNIEGQPTLLALDASPLERSAIAGTPATVPA